MKNQNPLRGLATINLFAADHAAAVKWYTELLGLPPYFTSEAGRQGAGLRRVPHRRLTSTSWGSSTPGSRPTWTPRGRPPGRGGRALARGRPGRDAGAAAVAWGPGSSQDPTEHGEGLITGLGGRSLRERPGDHVQPALPGHPGGPPPHLIGRPAESAQAHEILAACAAGAR